jgi:hypothetical protein
MKVDSALQDPSASIFERLAGSARRTSHIDVERLGSSSREGMRLRGTAKDSVTDSNGSPRIVAEAALEAELGPERVLRSLKTTPVVPPGLEGRTVAAGFRSEVDRVLNAEARKQTPLYLLVDDLPVASLIAGYADLYLGPVTPGRGLKADICAGWSSDGKMLRTLSEIGQLPVPVGPPTPPADADDDIPKQAPSTMRRRRIVDVTAGDEFTVRAMFRDTHADEEGVERVLHEYELEAAVDRERAAFTRCVATPKVLPWPECPSAAASASRIVGRSVTEVREFVRANLRGIETCTHLNDLLRSLADVAPLMKVLGR